MPEIMVTTLKPSISITPEATSRLSGELGSRVLRIAFTTGCGGSGYRLSFEGEPQADDVLVSAGGVTLALDDMAARKLEGAVVRYDPEQDGYVLDHPDASIAVWCG